MIAIAENNRAATWHSMHDPPLLDGTMLTARGKSTQILAGFESFMDPIITA